MHLVKRASGKRFHYFPPLGWNLNERVEVSYKELKANHANEFSFSSFMIMESKMKS